MFDPNNTQLSCYKPCIGGPMCGQYVSTMFVSVPPSGYISTTWFAADGTVIADINQHESIKTQDDFDKAVEQWDVIRCG